MAEFRRVWVVQEPVRPVDLSSAERLGPLAFILGGRASPSLTPGIAARKVFAALEVFSPAEDALMAVGGDPLGILLVGQGLAYWRHDESPITWLRWDRDRDLDGRRLTTGRYVPIVIPAQGRGATRGPQGQDWSGEVTV